MINAKYTDYSSAKTESIDSCLEMPFCGANVINELAQNIKKINIISMIFGSFSTVYGKEHSYFLANIQLLNLVKKLRLLF